MSFPHRIKGHVSVEDHAAWLHSLLSDQDVDEIDELIAENPPQRRSERETDRLFSILDEIEEERRSA